MKKKALLLLPLLLFSFIYVNGQEQYQILLKGGNILPEENVRTFAQQHQIKASETYGDHFYQLLQFSELPNEEAHQLIAQKGIHLLEYLPHLTYIAAIPTDLDLEVLIDLKVRTVLPLSKELKTDISLIGGEFGEWAKHKNKIGVSLKFHKNLTERELEPQFVADGIELIESNGLNNYIIAHIHPNDIDKIANLPYVAYLALEAEPGNPEDVEGRSLHRANAIDTNFPSGRNYSGEGLGVLCRDDGDIGPHIDFQGRLISDFVNGFGGTHGDGVSGIMAGSGNLNPRNRGMAAGSDLYAIDYIASLSLIHI